MNTSWHITALARIDIASSFHSPLTHAPANGENASPAYTAALRPFPLGHTTDTRTVSPEETKGVLAAQ